MLILRFTGPEGGEEHSGEDSSVCFKPVLTPASLGKISSTRQANSPQARIADSSSINAVSFSSACTTNRFPSPHPLCNPDRATRGNTGSLVHLPAVSVWSDFKDCHDLRFAFLLKATLSVQVNMFESHNGQSATQRAQSKPKGKYTGERIPPAKLQAIVNALAIGEPIEHIAARLHSSTQSVIATRERESLDITRRKELIRASAARLAANGFDKLNCEMDAGRINGALLVPVTGMATDKVIALSQDPAYSPSNTFTSSPSTSPAPLIPSSTNSRLKLEQCGTPKLLHLLLLRSQTRGQTPSNENH